MSCLQAVIVEGRPDILTINRDIKARGATKPGSMRFG
jgi:hypothetical protein